MKLRQFIHCAGIAAAVACFNAPLNASAAVESPIVGYTTITTSDKFTMLGCVFNGVDGKPVLIKDLLSGAFLDDDEIQVRNNSNGTYMVYTYYKGQWYNRFGKPVTNDSMSPGTAFWLKTPGRNVTVTIAGSVKKPEPYVYKAVQGFQMISPICPTILDLTQIQFTGLSDNDEIQIRKGATYTLYTYYQGQWFGPNGKPIRTPIGSVGTSLWLKVANANVTLTFPAAY